MVHYALAKRWSDGLLVMRCDEDDSTSIWARAKLRKGNKCRNCGAPIANRWNRSHRLCATRVANAVP
jgi:hypothetical protein